MNELVSPETFRWILTALVGGVAGAWAIYDTFNLFRLRDADKRDPLVRDKLFGYLVGITIGVLGVIGCLRFHDVM